MVEWGEKVLYEVSESRWRRGSNAGAKLRDGVFLGIRG